MRFRNPKFTALLVCSMLLLGKLFALIHVGECGSATCSIGHVGVSTASGGHQHCCCCHPAPFNSGENSSEKSTPNDDSDHDSDHCTICQSVYTAAIETVSYDVTRIIELCSMDVVALESLNGDTADVTIASPRGPPATL